MNWLIANLSQLLSNPGDYPGVGNERGNPVYNGIAIYADEFGSTRYVYYVSGVPVSGLQVVSRDGENAVIANVFTLPEYRRQKFATMLLNQAKQDFKSVIHSKNIEEPGKKWRDADPDAKPMALPLAPSKKQRYHRGVDRIDSRMTEEVADQEMSPQMEWGGAGAFGVVYRTAPGEMTKYFYDPAEFRIISKAYEERLDFVVPFLSPPEQVQDFPPIWKVRMKELTLLSGEEKGLFDRLEGALEYPTLDKVMEDWGHVDVDKVIKLYENTKYIREQNARSLWLTDIHHGNVGWDDDGRLKVFDLGTGNSLSDEHMY